MASKEPRGEKLISGLTGPLTFLAGGLLGAALATTWSRGTVDKDLAFYRTVRQIIEEEYVRPVDREALLTEAISGVATSLDPYSRFYTGEPLQRIEHDTRGTFHGIGAVFAYPTDAGRVLFPLPNSPAALAGLAVGDEILSFGGAHLADLPSGDFAARLRSLEPEPIELEIRRLSGDIERLELTPADVVDPTIRHADLVAPGVGYLAITSFSRRTPEEFDEAIDELQGVGARAFILDLRGNPGGVLFAATKIANRFIDSGVLVITETRLGHVEAMADPDEATLLGTPLVVLVDEESASASEVLAGALQDSRRAALVGSATYGKGTIQTLTPLTRPESILKITTGFYATPSGRSIDRFYRTDGGSAIWPDIEITLADDERDALHAHLAEYSPPLSLAQQVQDFEAQLGRTATPRVVRDVQFEAALALLVEAGS